MKKSIYVSTLVIIMTMFFLTSCKKDEVLNLSEQSKNVEAEAGNFSINVTSNTDWSVSTDANWCTLSTTSGTEDGVVTVNYEENTSDASRSSSIKFTTTEGLEKVFTLTQNKPKNPLLGTWKCTGSDYWDDFEFKNDATGHYRYMDTESGQLLDDSDFTYEYTDNSIIIDFGGGSSTFSYSISNGTELSLTWPDDIGTYLYIKQ